MQTEVRNPNDLLTHMRFAEEFNYEFTPFKDAIQKTYKAYKEREII